MPTRTDTAPPAAQTLTGPSEVPRETWRSSSPTGLSGPAMGSEEAADTTVAGVERNGTANGAAPWWRLRGPSTDPRQDRRTAGRAVGGLLLAVLFVGVAPQPVFAASARTPASPPPDGTISGACTFPVDLHTLSDREYETASAVDDGSLLVRTSGSLVVSLTNTTISKVLTVNISGPSSALIAPDGAVSVTGRGPGIFVFTPAQQATWHVPPIAVVDGLTRFAVDATADLTAFTAVGNITDMCAELR